MDSLTRPRSEAREFPLHREPGDKREQGTRRPGARLARILFLVSLAVVVFAPPALAERWAGGCAALIHITPAAEVLYGDDIRTSLGIVSLAAGIEFQQTDGPADLTYDVHLRLVLHETLHWLGLEHADSPTEVMYATIIDDSPRLGLTDRAELRDQSLANGCIPQPA